MRPGPRRDSTFVAPAALGSRPVSTRHDDSFGPPPAVLERRALARRRLMIQRRRVIAACVLAALGVLAIAAVISAIGGDSSSRTRAATPVAGASALNDPRKLLPPQRLAADQDRAVDRVLSYTPYIAHGG